MDGTFVFKVMSKRSNSTRQVVGTTTNGFGGKKGTTQTSLFNSQVQLVASIFSHNFVKSSSIIPTNNSRGQW